MKNLNSSRLFGKPLWKHAIHVFIFATVLACHENLRNRYQGYIEGDFLYLSTPIPGHLEQLNVRRGDQVQSGASLFSVEGTSARATRDEVAAKLAQARAQLEDLKKGARPSEVSALEAKLGEARSAYEFSKKDFDRLEYLLRSKASAQSEFDRVRSQYDQAKNKVTALEAELMTARLGARSDLVLAQEALVSSLSATLEKASWDVSQIVQHAREPGIVSDILYRVGEWVPAGKPVVVFLPPKNIKARTFVPERFLSSVHLGDRVKILIDGQAEHFDGQVAFIAPNAEYTPPVIYSRENREKLVYLIEISFDEKSVGNLNPGQPVEVVFEK